jgi:hypothetical protein
LTETENQPDQLGLATQSGSYLVALGNGCDGARPYQDVVVAEVDDYAAALQLSDGVCSAQVLQRMDFTPCAVDGDGVCDSAGVTP